MTRISWRLLLLVWNLYVMNFSSESLRINTPCTENDDNHVSIEDLEQLGIQVSEESSPPSIHEIQPIILGSRIIVLETMDLVARLQRSHVDNSCLNSTRRQHSRLDRIRSCRMYNELMAFNLSVLYEIFNITASFDEEYVVELTGHVSYAAVLVEVLHSSERNFPYKQLYWTVMNNVYDILCELSDFWTGGERVVLDSASTLYRNVLRYTTNSRDAADRVLLLRVLNARLRLIYEKLLNFNQARI